VLEEVAELFQNHNDLLDEFKHFLPKNVGESPLNLVAPPPKKPKKKIPERPVIHSFIICIVLNAKQPKREREKDRDKRDYVDEAPPPRKPERRYIEEYEPPRTREKRKPEKYAPSEPRIERPPKKGKHFI
jgi:histone deacetylase complex regulatory component SIN3